MLGLDPFQAGVNFLLGRLAQSLLARWLKFLFELIFSGGVAFLFITGSALAAGKAPAIAIGVGMVWAALAMTVVFRDEHSKLTAGMLAALPGEEAGKELAADVQIIRKAEVKS
jgi:hypothetical protein